MSDKPTIIAAGELVSHERRRPYRVVQMIYREAGSSFVVEMISGCDSMGVENWGVPDPSRYREIIYDLAQQVFSLRAEKEQLLRKEESR